MIMKPKHIFKARKRISSPTYPEERIYKLARRMISNAELYYKRGKFSPFDNLLYYREQNLLRNKINWYEKQLRMRYVD